MEPQVRSRSFSENVQLCHYTVYKLSAKMVGGKTSRDLKAINFLHYLVWSASFSQVALVLWVMSAK